MIEIYEKNLSDKENLANGLTELILSGYGSEDHRFSKMRKMLTMGLEKYNALVGKVKAIKKQTKDLKLETSQIETKIAKNLEILSKQI